MDLLLLTHLSDSEVIEGGETPTAACLAIRLGGGGWRRYLSLLEESYGQFATQQIPGMDEIIQALLQERRKVLVHDPIKIIRACLTNGYVPALWR
jgi:hypothetical protein